MPIYTFKNNETGEVYEEIMSISACEEMLEHNTHITQELNHLSIGDSVRLGLRKPDQAFRDILGNIKKRAGRHGKVNTF